MELAIRTRSGGDNAASGGDWGWALGNGYVRSGDEVEVGLWPETEVSPGTGIARRLREGPRAGGEAQDAGSDVHCLSFC